MTGGLIEKEEIYLFNQGEFFHSYQKFGAHIVKLNNQKGVHFTVWAPNAKRVSVVGDFNYWNGELHLMDIQDSTGVWTLFIPGLSEGEVYKYEIETSDGEIMLKSDPFAYYSEVRPKSASITYSLDNYNWGDSKWLKKRQDNILKERPILIYEAHLGSWRRKPDDSFYTYRDLADELVPYLKDMGFNCLELLPLMEHPFDGSWGYQITGYYSATSRYGTPKDLMYLIDRCHQADISVIMDWVPGHFCKDAHGLARFDGTKLYEKEEHKDWGTYKFDFGRTEVQSFLISNAIFWLDMFHIDGIRVDGVSSMLFLDFGCHEGEWSPNKYGGRGNLDAIAFIQKLNWVIKNYYPHVMMIAEESTDWPGVTGSLKDNGLGFDYKWNMGWMNDTLEYSSKWFPDRKDYHNLLTFSMAYAYSERFILPFSHDEVVHGKRSLLNRMPGDYWQKFAGLRLLYLYQMCHPGAKLLFMGGEIGQFIEWRYDAALDWLLLDYEKHSDLQNYVRKLNKVYLKEKALWENDLNWDGFQWVDVNNAPQSILAFIRKGATNEDLILVVLNFLPQTYENYRVGVPLKGCYKEILNSDSIKFGGSNKTNEETLESEDYGWHGKEFSISIKIPPLAGVIFKLTNA